MSNQATKLSGKVSVVFLAEDGSENRFHFNTVEDADGWADRRAREGVKIVRLEAQTADHFNSLIASMGLDENTEAALRR